MFRAAFRLGLVAVLVTSWFPLHAQDAAVTTAPNWPVAGQGLANLWRQPNETTLGTSTARTLAQKWVFAAASDVSATPTVDGNSVFFPDWAGNLYAVNKNTGALIWKRTIASYNGIAGSVVRVSPAVHNGALIVGDNLAGSHAGARVFAVSETTGNLLWMTKVESHIAAIITGSPVVANGRAYVGVSSTEEGLATKSTYACCTFRGSVVALDATTGKKLWQTYVMPPNGGKAGGYSGGAIWQPPAIDLTRNQLYVGTGNNYSVPPSVEACQAQNPKATNCTAANDFFDSAIAMDLATGAIKWAKKLSGYDVWTLACKPPSTSLCPDPAGPDFDLGGSGPNLLANLVGFGQKSGIYWALNPDTGAIVWAKPVGPGGPTGGIQWGTASDGTRIFVAIGNSNHQSHKLLTGQTITWGSWTALNASNGNRLWQTADPTPGAKDISSLSVANGVLYAGSTDPNTNMFALNAATGQILWEFSSGGSVIDAPSIVSGNLYWGSGYRRGGGLGNNKVYAFAKSTAPTVSVSTPTNNAAVISPVHYVASANTSCSTGIQYMRIYTSNTNSPVLVHTPTLDAKVTLAPGFYNTVVQTKDNCGRLGKTYINIHVTQ